MPDISRSAGPLARLTAASRAAERPAEPVAEAGQYLTFSINQSMYAVAILAVREIIEYGQLTTVPLMPPTVRGVINLRGSVVPVVDLQVRFGGESAPPGKRTCIVIVDTPDLPDTPRQVMGVVVDSVSEVLDIADADIEPAPSFGAQIRSDFIRGMGKVRGRFVIVLDIERVLALHELAFPAGAETAAAGATA